MNPAQETPPHARDASARMSWALALAGVAALGATLRLVGLRTESFWWDEYTSLAFLDAPSLLAFLRLNTTLDPATLPAYYTLEYLWHHHVHPGPVSLRYLSILIFLPAIPLAYATGRRLSGRHAGLVAALCIALSPVHVFHGQGIRMYVLFVTLVLCSAYTFLRVADGARARWWLAHAAANTALLWTHPFAGLFLAVEGLTLLCWPGRRARRVVCWGAVNVALALPAAAYVYSVQFWGAESTAAWLHAPGFGRFLGDLFLDDVVSATYQLRIAEEAWPTWVLRARPLFDAAMALAVAAALFAVVAGRVRLRAGRGATIFLLLWLALPPVTLYLLTVFWRPCIFPRYTAYCSVALYLLLGAAVAALPRAAPRWAAAAGIAVFLGYQAALTLPGPQRTDWRSVSARITRGGAPLTPVLVRDGVDRDVFVYNHRPAPHPVAHAETAAALAELAAWCAEWREAEGASAEPGPPVWILDARPYFDPRANAELEGALHARGLVFERAEFPAIRAVFAYAVRRTAFTPPARPPGPATPPDYPLARGDLAMAFAETGQALPARDLLAPLVAGDAILGGPYLNLVAALERGEAAAPLCAAIRAYFRAEGLARNGRAALAVEAYREALARDPALGVAWCGLGVALARAGNVPEALDALEQGMRLDPPGLALLFGRVARLLRAGENPEPALRALDPLLEALARVETGEPEAVRAFAEEALARDPGAALPHALAAYAHLGAGDLGAFQEAMARACARDPDGIGRWEPVLRAFLGPGGATAGARALETLRARGGFMPRFFVEALETAARGGIGPGAGSE